MSLVVPLHTILDRERYDLIEFYSLLVMDEIELYQTIYVEPGIRA